MNPTPENKCVDLRMAGHDVETVPVAAVHLPEGEVQMYSVLVQAAQGRSCGHNNTR